MVVTVADVMTPRSLFIGVAPEKSDQAAAIAEREGFTAVPIVANGAISSYWSRSAARVLPIVRRLKLLHDLPLPIILPRLTTGMTHFVYFQRELVGLINLSDLNKPLARLPWLQLLLDVEQRILETCVDLADETVADALGHAARHARQRQARARTTDVHLPLLAFAHFSEILRAAVQLKLITLNAEHLGRLVQARNRLAHGSTKLIESPSDGKELLWVCSRSQEIVCELVKHASQRSKTAVRT
ncbi:MAG: hypothetical protein ACE141_17415 [Bryobacteraceae bacterium]